MLTIIAIAALAGLLIVAAGKPDVFVVRRSGIIRATPERIVALRENLGNRGEWSAHEKKDPAMTRSAGGAVAAAA